MATSQKVKAPDGREWEIRSYRFRWPGVIGFRSSPGATAASSSYTMQALLVRLVFALVFSLVVWVISVLLKALVTPFRRSAWVDAVSLRPERKDLTWKTSRAHAHAVAAEIAEQLAAGQPPQPQNAKPVDR